MRARGPLLRQSSEDKNILASGFITAASGGTHGGADIVLNSIDLGIEGLTSFLQIKKSSVKEGDPKNFEAGTRFRHAIVHNGAKFVAIRTARNQSHAPKDDFTAFAKMSSFLSHPRPEIGSLGMMITLIALLLAAMARVSR